MFDGGVIINVLGRLQVSHRFLFKFTLLQINEFLLQKYAHKNESGCIGVTTEKIVGS